MVKCLICREESKVYRVKHIFFDLFLNEHVTQYIFLCEECFSDEENINYEDIYKKLEVQ